MCYEHVCIGNFQYKNCFQKCFFHMVDKHVMNHINVVCMLCYEKKVKIKTFVAIVIQFHAHHKNNLCLMCGN